MAEKSIHTQSDKSVRMDAYPTELSTFAKTGQISPLINIDWGDMRGIEVHIVHDDRIVDHSFAAQLEEIAGSLTALAQNTACDISENEHRSARTELALLNAICAIELVTSLARGGRKYECQLSMRTRKVIGVGQSERRGIAA